ncbi:MAG: sugar ABC transporter ATP-binding protein, partial [Comamonadaceae bacterium]
MRAGPVLVPRGTGLSESLVPFVEVRGVSKRYPGVLALDNASLAIHPGEVLSLTGENGSGKSTLAKIVGGVEQPDRGTIVVNGVERKIANPVAARSLGIVMISQELTLAPQLSVAENVLMGRLPRTSWRTVD